MVTSKISKIIASKELQMKVIISFISSYTHSISRCVISVTITFKPTLLKRLSKSTSVLHSFERSTLLREPSITSTMRLEFQILKYQVSDDDIHKEAEFDSH